MTGPTQVSYRESYILMRPRFSLLFQLEQKFEFHVYSLPEF